MKRIASCIIAVTALVVACTKKSSSPAEEETAIGGVAFSKTADTINLNTKLDSSVFIIRISDSITKAELQSRLKLKLTTDSAVENKDYKVTTTVTENPMQINVTVKALPSLARTNFHVQIALDESMKVSDNSEKMALVIKPFSTAAAWFQSTAYYYPYFYYYTDSTAKWTSMTAHYSVLDTTDAAVLGFVNNWVAESGVGFFNMHRLYATEIGSNNIKTAKINVPRALELIPTAAGARSGKVNVIPQQVTVTRSAGTTFQIGISGSGTFDLDTKVIDVEMNFDNTKIGGTATNKYKYKISVDKLTL
jgi:hypothetical protein